MKKQLTYWMLLTLALLMQFNIQAQNNTTNFEIAIDEPTKVCQDEQVILHAQLYTYLGFKDVLAPENWSLTNNNSDGSVDTSNAPTSIALTGGNNGSFYSGTTDYSITIPVTGTLSFNWEYNSEDGPYSEYAQIIYDDETSYLTGFDLNIYPLQSGTMSIEVEAGKAFTIRMYTDDNYYDGATVVFSKFGIKSSSIGTPVYSWTASDGAYVYAYPNGLTGLTYSTGTFTITAVLDGNTSTDNVTVAYYSNFEGVITEDSVFYTSDADNGIMTATPTGGTGPYTYLWSTGETESTVYNKGVGTYTCTITDANGCSTTIEKELIFTEIRPTVFEVTGGGTNCYYDDIEIGLSGSEEDVIYYLYKNTSYQTSMDGTGSAISFGNYYDAGIYTVEAHNLDYDTLIQMSGVAIINNPSYNVAIAQPAVGCVGGQVLLTSSIPYATGTMQSTSGFTGAFAPENWQHVNGDSVGSVNTNNAPTSIVITSDNSDSFNPGNTYYSITMPMSGLLSFDWTLDSPTDPGAHQPMVSHLGQTNLFTGLSAFQDNIQSGFVILQVVAGEVLTLRMETIGQNFDIASLTISNFTVTTEGVGTPSYLWTASEGGVIDGPANGPTANAAAPGTYTLTITELGCSFSDYTYVYYSTPVEANIELIEYLTSPLAEDGKLTVLGEGGSSPFTYAWNTGANTASISGIGAGTYSCTVSSGDGCEAYAEFELVYNVINPATYEVTGGGSICDGAPAIPVGLSSSEVGVTYQLQLDSSNIGTVVEGTGSALSFGNFSEAGNYSVEATSTYSQYSTEMYNYAQIITPKYVVTIDEPEIACSDFYQYVYISSLVEDVANFGNPTYLWTASNGGAIYGATNNSTQVYATASGTYTLTVTEGGCSYSDSVDLIISTPIVPVMTVTAELTGYYAEDGGLTVSTTGGTAPYSYLWNTGATTPTITGLGEGTYSCYVTDANGCYSTVNVEKYLTYIPEAPEAFQVTGGGLFCAGEEGAEIGLSGSEDGVYYQVKLGSTIVNGALGTGSAISLGFVYESGTYTVTALDFDSNLTSTMLGSAIATKTDYTISIEQPDIICTGEVNVLTGYVAITSSGGGTPSYLWTSSNGGVIDGATDGLTANATTAGTYTLTTTLEGCILSDEVVVEYYSPVVIFEPQVTPACLGDIVYLNPSVSFQAGPGVEPAVFSWSSSNGGVIASSSGQYATVNQAGTYTLIITSVGCTTSGSVDIEYYSPMVATAEVTNPLSSSFANDGVLTASVTGGTPPYTFGWNSGTNVNPEIATNLTSGTHSFYVSDANGCYVYKEIELTYTPTDYEIYEVTGGGTVCAGAPAIAIGLSDSEDGVNYQLFRDSYYVMDSFVGTGSSLTMGNFTAAGTYTVVATNPAGELITTMLGNAIISTPNYTVTIEEPTIICAGETNVLVGSIELEPSETESPIYSWTASNGGTIDGATDGVTANATTEGTYTLTVSIAGCTFSDYVTLEYLNTIDATITVYTALTVPFAEDGGITVTATGGAEPYTYLWNTGATTASIGDISAGLYTCNVTDGNGCIVSVEKEFIYTTPVPVAYQVTGGGVWLCPGSETFIGLSNSETGVSYQLKLDGTNLGTAVEGTGSSFNFGNFDTAGNYTVEGTSIEHGTNSTMTGSYTIRMSSFLFDIDVSPISCADTYAVIKPVVGTITGFKNGLAPENWTLVTENTNCEVSYDANTNQLVLTQDSESYSGAGSIDYSITMPYSGNVHFYWSFNSNDIAGNEYPQLLYNGTPLTSFVGFDNEVSSTQYGYAWVDAEAGTNLTLRMFTQNNTESGSQMIISDFVMSPFQSGVPTLSWTASNGGYNYGPVYGSTDGSINVSVGGTYTLTATLDGCSITKEIVVDYVESPSDVTIWNGTEWSNGEPFYDKTIIIDGDLVISAQLYACKVVITENGSLTFQPDAGAYIMRNFDNNATAADFVIENEALIYQYSDIQNEGPATVNVNSFPLYRQDYTLWSSPVENQNLRSFSPQTLYNRFSSYNASLGTVGEYVQEIVTTNDVLNKTFETANGYLIRMPNNWADYVDAGTPGVSYAGVFKGVPQNGTITVPLSTANGGMNLVGNPYPSPINIDNFFGYNPNIEQTIYYWRKRNGASGSGYATYNSLGFVSVQPELSGIADALDTQPFISTGQGFFVRSLGATELTFNNMIRSGYSNGVFLRNETADLHRFRLNLSNNSAVVGQTLIGYTDEATAGIDNGFDSSYFNDSATALTSLIDGSEYAIQGLGLPFDVNSAIPLGFKTELAGTYTISLSNYDGLFIGNQDIYIKDNVTGMIHNVKESAYSFTANEGIANDRFEVVYQNSTLGAYNPDLDINKVMVYKEGHNIVINAMTMEMQKVELYDIRGSLIQTLDNVNATTATFSKLNIANQVVLVKITSVDNTVTTKKIVF